MYDDSSRLHTVHRNGSVFATYSYDQNGNRLTRTDADGNVEQGATDNQDRLSRYAGETFVYTTTQAR